MKKSINEFLDISFGNVNGLIDTAKVVGEPIVLDNETTIIPISKMTYGFGSGGSEFNVSKNKDKVINDYQFESASESYPFGGGTLLGINVTPEAFLFIKNGEVKLIKNKNDNNAFDTIIEIIKKALKKQKK